MKMKKFLPVLLSLLLILSGCSTEDSSESTSAAASAETISSDTQDTATIDTSEMFTDRDMEIGYDEEASIYITLSGDTASCDSDTVSITGSIITISEEGTYILSGTLGDGMVIVNAEDSDKIQLVLNGVEITNSTSAAVYVAQADKVVITTASGSENLLSNGGEYVAIDDNNIDAAIFSKADLTLNGAGTLTINAAAGHGVVSKDDLVLTSGSYDITSEKHGLSGKDSVRIASGTYVIVSGKDGIHAENADDTTLGFLYVLGGSFQITADGDGMSAAAYLQIEDGDFSINAGGGSAAASLSGNSRNSVPDSDIQTTETEDSSSTKGLKATTALMINGGTFTVDSADDALHSNSNLSIASGDFTIASGDDAIHADSAVSISGGDFDITESYEGIEGLSIDISGGSIRLAASDDGLNAAGGNDNSGGGRGDDIFASTEGAYITISGGTIYINAYGDGIDSNGSLTISGGETYVSGPTDSANGALDFDSEATISGGVFVAAGSSGMAQNFSSSSTQGAMMVTVSSGSAGSTILLSDSSGNELVSWEADKAYNSVIISCPELTEGSSYTLTTDGTSTEITMDSLVYTSGGAGGDMNAPGDMGGNMNHGGMRGNRGNRP